MTVDTHDLDGYDAPPIEWAVVREVMSTDVTHAPGTGGPNPHMSWLTTIGEDGTPHVRPIGVIQRADCWYFNSNPDTLKAPATSPETRAAP